MKKKYVIPIVIILVLIIVGGLYYKFNYIDTVTEYYRIVYYPPINESADFSSVSYTEPKTDIKKINPYLNDSMAVLSEVNGEKNYQRLYKKEYTKCCKYVKGKDFNKDIEMTAKKQAVEEELNRKIILLRFTHRAGYDSDESFKFIKKHFFDEQKLKDFCDENKISYAIYPIS